MVIFITFSDEFLRTESATILLYLLVNFHMVNKATPEFKFLVANFASDSCSLE